MAVKYTVVSRVNPQDPQGPKKYYPRVKSINKVGTREVADRISGMSTLSSIDVFASTEGFLDTVSNLLADGCIVKLGDFGTFSLRIHSVGSDDPKDVSARNITRTMVTFRPSKRFRKILDGIEFEEFQE